MNIGHIPTCIYSNKNERKLFRLYIGTYYVSIIGHAIMPEGKKNVGARSKGWAKSTPATSCDRVN